jgi:hypothetical protein
MRGRPGVGQLWLVPPLTMCPTALRRFRSPGQSSVGQHDERRLCFSLQLFDPLATKPRLQVVFPFVREIEVLV